MKKKICITLFLLLILVANLSFASYSTVTMSVVEEPVCTIEMGTNSKFEKKLVSKDLQNKEVTIQLQVTNGEEIEKPTGEIMIVLDNSDSMNDEVSSTTRKELIFESAKTLVTNLLKDNTDLKIGIVSFSTNADQSKEATIEDAQVQSTLSTDVTALKTAISNITTDGARTDLQAGLLLASQQFSEEKNNKYIITLTDGVPNVAIGYNTIYYGDEVITRTKQQLLDLKNKGINLITMLSGIKDESYVAAGITKTFGEIIAEIFGTAEAPTAGTFHYITDDKIEETITKTIYSSLLPIKKTFKDIEIVDYFPAEIINNFDFAYVSDTNIGEISPKVDTTNNSITWTIPELASGETATVQYTLKLKQDFDSKIVDKILNTNEKVDITYQDLENKEQAKTSDITPKLKLAEPPAELPKAGTPFLIGFTVVAAGLFLFSIIKLTIIHKKMN